MSGGKVMDALSENARKQAAGWELVWTCPWFVWVGRVDGYSLLRGPAVLRLLSRPRVNEGG